MRIRRGIWLALVVAALSWSALRSEAAVKNADCMDAIEGLQAMKKAQLVLMNSLVKKNDSMAETLDLYADRMQQQQGFVKKDDISGIKKSAQSFRKHQSREEAIVRKFDSTASELIKRIEVCLKNRNLAQQ